MAYKVFTNGSVLQASEINDNLMRQSVMVFSNSSARTAAITSPLEGMLTWLEDVNRYESYNGTSWVSPFGSTFITRTAFTASGSVSFDNVFTSEYDTYNIVASMRGNGTATGLNIYLRAGGVNLTSASYTLQTIEASGTSVTGFRDTAQGAWTPAAVRNDANRLYLNITLSNPAVSTLGTNLQSLGGDAGGSIQRNAFGHNTSVAAYDGITFLPQASTITGEISIYGLRK